MNKPRNDDTSDSLFQCGLLIRQIIVASTHLVVSYQLCDISVHVIRSAVMILIELLQKKTDFNIYFDRKIPP